MKSYHKHVAHILISLALLLISLAIISRWDTVEWLAGVSPYDVPTSTISSPTIVYERTNIDSDNTSSNPDDQSTVGSEQIEKKEWEVWIYVATDKRSPEQSWWWPRDVARKERKIICHEMYQEKKEVVINHDQIVERCATMMTLQYAFESGHWKSRKCVNQKNCFWIKNNRRDRCIKSPNGFCIYSAQIEGMRDFAEMFMKHYEGYKSVKAYLDVYSPDGNGAYPQFVKSKYDETLQYFINN